MALAPMTNSAQWLLDMMNDKVTDGLLYEEQFRRGWAETLQSLPIPIQLFFLLTLAALIFTVGRKLRLALARAD